MVFFCNSAALPIRSNSDAPLITMLFNIICIVKFTTIVNRSKSTILLYFEKRKYNALPKNLHCITICCSGADPGFQKRGVVH